MSFIKKFFHNCISKKNSQIDNNKVSNITQNVEEELIHCTTETMREFTLDGLKTIGKIVEIYDGDTCKIILINENKLIKFTCRLKFINCPEMRPLKNKINREIEIKEAIKSRNRLLQLSTNCNCELINDLSKKEMILLLKKNTKIIQIHCYNFDKYGRLLVVLLNGEKNINDTLITEGFAKNYNNGTKEEFIY